MLTKSKRSNTHSEKEDVEESNNQEGIGENYAKPKKYLNFYFKRANQEKLM